VNKAPQLQLSEDRLSVTGYKGFRSIRGNIGTHVGTWYCEARITHAGPTGRFTQ
jgi:Set1/Ash2 histone methyltransferase complex subunit ASH2